MFVNDNSVHLRLPYLPLVEILMVVCLLYSVIFRVLLRIKAESTVCVFDDKMMHILVVV